MPCNKDFSLLINDQMLYPGNLFFVVVMIRCKSVKAYFSNKISRKCFTCIVNIHLHSILFQLYRGIDDLIA